MTINQARHEANIAAKAATLFTEGGYRYKPFATCPTLFFVYPPQVEAAPYIVDVEARHCSCRGHREAGICSHRLAVEDVTAWEASVAAREAEYAPIDRIA